MRIFNYLRDNFNINFNAQQQNAVEHVNGPCLINACPGGGKTSVIIGHCGYLVKEQGVDPESILTLTFSQAAANDMKDRYKKWFSGYIDSDMKFSTIHSFCNSVIARYCYKHGKEFPSVIEGKEKEDEVQTDEFSLTTQNDNKAINKIKVLKNIYLDINKEYITEDKLDELTNAIGLIKNCMLKPENIKADELEIPKFVEIYNAYEKFKKDNKCIDYDDMLTSALTILNKDSGILKYYRSKYRYINVDESQDTSKIQHEIIRLLVSPVNNVFMVGDIDQSIYMFRGAEPKELLDFEKTYPGAKIYYMDQNYRSTKHIIIPANMFIKQNKERYDKNMFTENGDGHPVRYTCFKERNEQYSFILDVLKKEPELSDRSVLYRNNSSAIPLIDVLDRNNIPFYCREFKMNFFKHWVTNDIKMYLEFALDNSRVDLFEKFYYKLNAYISKSMLDYVQRNRTEGENVFDVLLRDPSLLPKQKDTISSLKLAFKLMLTSKGKKIIEYIDYSLNYGEFLKKKRKETKSDMDSATQVFGVLKAISINTDCISDFINRFDSLQKIIKESRKNRLKNVVTLSSIHSSKGLEYLKVYIIDLIDEVFPSKESIDLSKKGNRALLEEEVRTFFVGVTRAKEHLELLAFSNIDGVSVKPSRFIESFMKYVPSNLSMTIGGLVHHSVETIKKAINPVFDGDSCAISDMDMIQIGSSVWHKKYGAGTVVNLSANIAEIEFNKNGRKLLDLNICIKSRILRIYLDEDKKFVG